MRATLKRCLQLMVILALLSVVSPVQAFYNPSTGKWLNRDPIGERGGINSMAFVKNDLINIVDFLGLDTAVKKCTIEIHVGHHRGADPHIPTDLKNEPCSAASVIGCEANNITVPTPIPGIEPRPEGNINRIEAARIALLDFAAAKTHAKTLCKQSCKCESIKVSILCSGFTFLERQPMPGGVCGKTETVPCK